MNQKKTIFLLTGPPGIGKTTIIRAIVDELKQMKKIKCQGFYTEEVCAEKGEGRIGFDIVTLEGRRGQLARKNMSDNYYLPRVGKYSVFLNVFEELALPQLCGETCQLLIIDEVGKMELLSRNFDSAINIVMDQLPMIVTVPEQTHKPVQTIEHLRLSEKTKIYEITKSNRNEIANEIMQSLKSLFQI